MGGFSNVLVCGLMVFKVTQTAGFAGSVTSKPQLSAATYTYHVAWNRNSKSIADRGFSFCERISRYFAPSANLRSCSTAASSVFWQAAPFVAGAGLLWQSRICKRSWLNVRLMSGGKDRLSEVTHNKTPALYKDQRTGSSIRKMSASDDIGESPSLTNLNGIFAVDKPRNWTSFDVVNKVRSTLGKKLREENPSLTFKQCRVKVHTEPPNLRRWSG